MIHFANWHYLLFLPLIPSLFWITRIKKGLPFSSVKILVRGQTHPGVRTYLGKLLIACGLLLAICALARPQSNTPIGYIPREGIDIVMVLDVSGSMQSMDFLPNRLEAARKTIDDFILGRINDRIALVIFAGTAYTRLPLTADHQVVRESLASVSSESVNTDGTAIGMAISVGLNRLKKSDAASRIMILVTDGDNNAGDIDPLTASKLAQELGIKIYTIGAGSDTLILPVQTIWGTRYQQYSGGFDEELLTQIAQITGGQYFRATDTSALEQVFTIIDQLEKSTYEDTPYLEYHELAYPLIAGALLFLVSGLIVDRFVYVQIP